MTDEITKQPESNRCVLCNKKVESVQDEWKFKNFNICYECIEQIFKDII
jgi:hypothetical protein